MKKTLLFLLLLSLVLVSGCTDGYRVDFAGAGQNWEVFYVANVYDSTSEERSGTVKYVGAGEAPATISYKIGNILGEASGTGISLSEGVASIGTGSCTGCSVTRKDSELTATIEWDGKTEKIKLSPR